ncbi:hypothetical protein LAV73_20685 [Lysinibacillus xylanilyticus]|uniref:hypothetical protein n=1 Tax=Lysinibacillus xylanilyticus TaxID=582475 RepID=UPI002B24B7B2|nr:hypothetical protein [Lysinibacillus xylanilyticus]MEB2282371.1 hypothetical protein [Lysinibacillus xylanilyticus]
MMAAINDIAAINKIEMDPKHLALDVYALDCLSTKSTFQMLAQIENSTLYT